MIFTSKLPSNQKPISLAEYLSNRFTYYDKTKWAERIMDGKISLNGEICLNPANFVGASDTIAYDAGEIIEPEADLNYSVVYEDDWLLGVNKPGNLLIHRSGKAFKNNLVYQLRFVHNPSYPDAHSTHRIDRETSGLVLLTKNKDQVSFVNKLFIDNKITKHYCAIVNGVFPESIELIDSPIGSAGLQSIPYKYWIDQNGKPALTKIISVEKINEFYSFVRLEPKTGRTHQLRVHLAATGYPIIGDKLYSVSEDEHIAWRDNRLDNDKFIIPRQALHCTSMSFIHPFTNKPCTIAAPLPNDMKNFIIERNANLQDKI